LRKREQERIRKEAELKERQRLDEIERQNRLEREKLAEEQRAKDAEMQEKLDRQAEVQRQRELEVEQRKAKTGSAWVPPSLRAAGATPSTGRSDKPFSRAEALNDDKSFRRPMNDRPVRPMNERPSSRPVSSATTPSSDIDDQTSWRRPASKPTAKPSAGSTTTTPTDDDDSNVPAFLRARRMKKNNS